MENKTKELEKNLLIFSLLVTQSELYGYSLKGNVKHEFAYRVNEYLRTSHQLMTFINKHIDSDTLEAVSYTHLTLPTTSRV